MGLGSGSIGVGTGSSILTGVVTTGEDDCNGSGFDDVFTGSCWFLSSVSVEVACVVELLSITIGSGVVVATSVVVLEASVLVAVSSFLEYLKSFLVYLKMYYQ